MLTNNTKQKYYSLIINMLPPLIHQRWKVIAVLIGKKPISIATNNLEKTHPIMSKANPNKRAHAEIRCLRNAPLEKIKGSTIHVYRFSEGSFRMAKPCPTCMSYIQEMGVKKIIYTTNHDSLETMRV